MAFNPNTVDAALAARSTSREQLAQRIGLSPQALEEQLSRQPQPRQPILDAIARELAIPDFAFFMRENFPFHEVLPDFRAAKPAPRSKQPETLKAIIFAEGVQRAARAAENPPINLPAMKANKKDSIESFALKMRNYLKISLDDQTRARNASDFYVQCRKKIEDQGIFVLHESFPSEDGSGFCLAHPSDPVIVINTKNQSRGRRLFTLIHELAHVLLGKSGISDPFINTNKIESICNHFSAAFLVPRDFVERLLTQPPPFEPDEEDVRLVSRRLKISQEAAVLRLETLGLFRAGSHARWKRSVEGRNPDSGDRQGGGGEPPPQEKVKLAKYGFAFAKTFHRILSEGRITPTNLYRSTGLKPKYQTRYFEFANALDNANVSMMQIDD